MLHKAALSPRTVFLHWSVLFPFFLPSENLLQWHLAPLIDDQTVLMSLKLNFASGLIIYMMDN